MTLHQRPPRAAQLTATPKPPERGQWQWNWQRVAKGVWIVLVLVLLAIFLANIPGYYQSLNVFCNQPSPESCPTGQLTLGNVQALTQLHFSVTVVAAFLATLTLAVSVLYWVVGLVIFWRKSHEWMGLLFSLSPVLLGAVNIFGFPAALTPQFVQLLTNITTIAMAPVGMVFFITFPTGQFTPRWTWAVLLLLIVITLPIMPSVVSILAIPLVVGVQVYRYMRIYDAVQRQQTKWFVFGFGVGLFFVAFYNVLGAFVPGLSAPNSWYQLFNVLPWLFLWMILILSIGISILRYRLWDIDVIINRTLVYGSLTVLLVALYVGLIVALQALVRIMTGSISQQPWVIVGSTLVIAALFQPLRRGLQNVIDRRFYRHKYDATKVVAAFSVTLRNGVDIDQVSGQLVAVVQETMQPAHVSLWLRQPTRRAIPSPQIGKPLSEEARVHEENAGHGV